MRSTLLLLLLAAPLSAQEPIDADRPGLADGSQVVGRGAFQAELGIERDRDAGGHETSAPLLLRYGIAKPLELRIETEDGRPSIGFKVRVLDQPSLAVIVRRFRSSADLRLAADFDLGEQWSLNPNVGVTRRDGGDGRFTAALAALTLQDNVSKTLNLFVDGAVQKPEERRGRSALLVDTGAAWIVNADTQLDVEVGWGARGRTTPNVFVGAGISRRF